METTESMMTTLVKWAKPMTPALSATMTKGEAVTSM